MPEHILAPLDWLGQAALAVGAGIEVKRLWRIDPALWIGITLRLAICPMLFLLIALLIPLPSDQIVSGALLAAAPSASSGFILARQMGGDAELYAGIFTWQVVLSALTLPLWLIFSRALLSWKLLD